MARSTTKEGEEAGDKRTLWKNKMLNCLMKVEGAGRDYLNHKESRMAERKMSMSCLSPEEEESCILRRHYQCQDSSQIVVAQVRWRSRRSKVLETRQVPGLKARKRYPQRKQAAGISHPPE